MGTGWQPRHSSFMGGEKEKWRTTGKKGIPNKSCRAEVEEEEDRNALFALHTSCDSFICGKFPHDKHFQAASASTAGR